MFTRRRIFEIMEIGRASDRTSRIFDLTLIALILANVAAIILASFQEIHGEFSTELRVFETVSIVLFSVEYLMRLFTADMLHPQLRPGLARLRWMVSFHGIIDLLAILPFFAAHLLPLFVPFDLRFLRMVRILRLLRIFKLQRYSSSMQIIGHILSEKKEELLTTVFISAILMIIASTFMYYLEHEAQPDVFPNVLATMWWAMATLTTVGYGDVFPVTAAGKVFAGIIAILGIGIIALPTGILSAAFIDRISMRRARQREATHEFTFCPHCGERLREE